MRPGIWEILNGNEAGLDSTLWAVCGTAEVEHAKFVSFFDLFPLLHGGLGK